MNQDQDNQPGAVVTRLSAERELNAPAAYWQARYEALEARVDDPAMVNAAAAVVLSAATIANNTGQPFRQVFEATLNHILRVRRERTAEVNRSKNGGFHPARKRK